MACPCYSVGCARPAKCEAACLYIVKPPNISEFTRPNSVDAWIPIANARFDGSDCEEGTAFGLVVGNDRWPRDRYWYGLQRRG